jgi:hypothetical protein
MKKQVEEFEDFEKIELVETRKEKNLTECLLKYKTHYVEYFSELEKILDFKHLDDGVPTILTKHNYMIIIDLPNFNNTYLLSLVNNYLDEHGEEFKDLKILYIDKVHVMQKLFINRVKDKIVPEDFDTYPISILTICPRKNEFCIFEESEMVPINEVNMKFIFDFYLN